MHEFKCGSKSWHLCGLMSHSKFSLQKSLCTTGRIPELSASDWVASMDSKSCMSLISWLNLSSWDCNCGKVQALWTINFLHLRTWFRWTHLSNAHWCASIFSSLNHHGCAHPCRRWAPQSLRINPANVKESFFRRSWKCLMKPIIQAISMQPSMMNSPLLPFSILCTSFPRDRSRQIWW